MHHRLARRFETHFVNSNVRPICMLCLKTFFLIKNIYLDSPSKHLDA